MTKTGLVLTTCALFFCSIASHCFADSQEKASQLLDNYVRFLDRIRSLECRVEQGSSRIGDLAQAVAPKHILDSTGRLRFEPLNRVRWSEKTLQNGNEYNTEVLFDGDEYVNSSIDPNPLLGHAVYSFRKPSWTNALQALKISGSSFAFVFGFHHRDFLARDKGLVKLAGFMRSSGSLRIVNDSTNTATFEWVGSHHRIRIELSPENDFAARKIEYSLLKVPSRSEPRVVDKHVFEVQEFERVDGLSFPTVFRSARQLSEGIEFNGELRPAAKTITETRLSSVRLNVTFSNQDFKLETKIPNYTPVDMQDVQHLKFYWLDGKIVPATDEVAARLARDASLKRNGSRWGTARLLGSLGLIALCIVLGCFLKFGRQKRQ